MQQKLALFERAAEVVFELKTGHGLRPHGFVENREPCLAVVFRTIHRRVGVAQNVFRRLIFAAPQGNADAGADEDLVAAKLERGRQTGQESLCRQRRVARSAQAVEQNREFVAAQPGDGLLPPQVGNRVGAAHAALESPRDRDQKLVTDLMTEAVIDILEPVEVEEQNREQIGGIAQRAAGRPSPAGP